MHEIRAPVAQLPSRLFANLAIVMVLLTLGLIVFGAVVRVTDSGLGCGNDWPLCDGRIIPPLSNVTAWVEWSHRLFATLIGLLGLAMLGLAWRQRHTGNGIVLKATVAAAILFVVQSVLGAAVVLFDLPPTMVTLHLGSAMLLVGALLVAAIGSRQGPSVPATGLDPVTTLAYITTALSLVTILTGALVRGSGATLACSDWPLCNGVVIPLGQGELQIVHVVHRFAVVGLGATLSMLIWYMYQWRERRVFLLAVVASIGYLSQAFIGALFVWSNAKPYWGVAHVALASLTWVSLVTVSAIDALRRDSPMEMK